MGVHLYKYYGAPKTFLGVVITSGVMRIYLPPLPYLLVINVSHAFF